MKVIENYRAVPADVKNAVIAIGNFDGVHRGHQAVLKAALEEAKRRGVAAGVMVFEPHPREFFQPNRPVFRLVPLGKKLTMFEKFGLDLVAVLPFNADLAGMPAVDFIDRVLIEGFAVSHVVTGFNFFFGKGRDGNPEVLREMGQARGFGVTIVEAQGAAGERFSSSRVRELLQEGDPRGAAKMLGYRWRVSGTVTGGAQRGTWLGYPTANIELRNAQEFRHGIYAVRIYIDGKRHLGAAYLGTRPTFDDGAPVLETFLFDFNEDIYGREIEVELIDYVRDDARFRSPDDLKEQMTQDCEKAREILQELEKDDPLPAYPMLPA